MFIIGLLTGKVGITAESRLKNNFGKERTHEVRNEDDNETVIRKTTELVNLAGKCTAFENMRSNIEYK